MVGTKIRHHTLFPTPTNLHPAVSEFSTDTNIEGQKWWLTRQSLLSSLPRLICHRESYPISLWLWGRVLGLQIRLAPQLLHYCMWRILSEDNRLSTELIPRTLGVVRHFCDPFPSIIRLLVIICPEGGGSGRITGSSSWGHTSYRDWKLAPEKISWMPQRKCDRNLILFN